MNKNMKYLRAAFFLCSCLFSSFILKGNQGSRSKAKHQVKVSPVLLGLLQTDELTPNRKALQEFFLVLAVCNTVVPIKVDEEVSMDQRLPNIEYQAESPDEQALVSAAAAYGYVLMERSTKHVVVEVQGELQRYF